MLVTVRKLTVASINVAIIHVQYNIALTISNLIPEKGQKMLTAVHFELSHVFFQLYHLERYFLFSSHIVIVIYDSP